jgi:methylamine dehydrogenase heavy chain
MNVAHLAGNLALPTASRFAWAEAASGVRYPFHLVRWSIALAGIAALCSGLAHAQSRTASAPALPLEESDTAVLPAAGPHRVFVFDLAARGANVIEADDEKLKLVGLVPSAFLGTMTLSRDASKIYIAETILTRGNRGERQDVLAVYDGATLNLVKEINLPGRLMVVPKAQLFDTSEDNRLAYVYDMIPSSSVHVIDLDKGEVIASIDMPGCALAFPYGPRSVASICGDGTVGVATVPASGEARAVFSKPFFDPDNDPIFEGSVADKTSGEAWFLSYTGKIYPAKLGEMTAIGNSWSVAGAAGLPVPGVGVQELAWRPGGAQVMALHRAAKRLYVLMHPGNHWTHKMPGTEVWVLDAVRQTLIRRINLKVPARSIAVSQDDKPLLYAFGNEDRDFTVYDATSGESLRQRKLPGLLAWVPGN